MQTVGIRCYKDMKQDNQKRRVHITVQGVQHDISDEVTESSCYGECYYVAGKHIIRYEEVSGGDDVTAKTENLVKIGRDSVEIIKKGAICARMNFEKGREQHSLYRTPLGTFDMTIAAKELQIEKTGKGLRVDILYRLGMNRTDISECSIKMQISYY